MLAALTSNTLSRSLRQLSVDSGVSWSRTADIVDDLADLGLVERRQTPAPSWSAWSPTTSLPSWSSRRPICDPTPSKAYEKQLGTSGRHRAAW